MSVKTIVPVTAMILLFGSQSAPAQGSAQNHSQGIEHSARAAGHSIAGTAQLSAGVVAVPLIASGGIGEVSGQAGAEMWNLANTPPGTPLPVTEETISSGPSPAEAMARDRNGDRTGEPDKR